MNLLVTILAFLAALAVLIVIHEFGHYVVARACGVKVLRFSIGFGRPLVRKQFHSGGTEWVIAAIPLGGYVKMLDEREAPVPREELEFAFNRKNVWQRVAIVAAGPIANFLLAIVLYWGIFIGGTPDARPVLAKPAPETPAARAGIERGDLIVSISGTAVQGWQDARWHLLRIAVDKRDATLEVEKRDGARANKRLVLESFDLEGLEADPVARIGLRLIRPDAVIGRVVAGGPADRAGLHAGDRVLSIDAQPISDWDNFVSVIRRHPEQSIRLRIVNNAGESDLLLTPEANIANGRTIGRIGAEPSFATGEFSDLYTVIRHDAGRAAMLAIVKTWETSVFSLKMIGRMITGDISLKNISGPVTIADYAGQSAQAGWVTYFVFLAMVSISLGVLNLLPIPLLDGGHLMYYFAEIALGRPLSEGVMEAGQRVGFALLIILMAFALYNDINRLISG